jgi:hypothetical protein
MNKAVYSVWVDGVKVNDHYLTKSGSATLAEEYSNNGHTDVYITATKED